jgi:hypothetical protein
MSASCIPIVSNLPVSKEWINDGINGVIESEDEDPIQKALNINIKKLYEINSKLIREKAIRSINIKEFQKIYLKSNSVM